MEDKTRQDSAKMPQEPPQSRIPRELPSGLRPPGRRRCAPTFAVPRAVVRPWAQPNPSFGRIFEEERTFTLS